MRRMRNFIKRYERWFMLGLLVFILIVFTVTDEIVDALSGAGGARIGPEDVAGSFRLGDRVQVTWEQFDRARARYAILARSQAGPNARIRDTEVWTHLLLLEAARRQGIEVSNQELVEALRAQLPLGLMDDPERYRQLISLQLGCSHVEFEEAHREGMIAQRFRDLYRDSYRIAPAATREKAAREAPGKGSEFVRVSWAALDAPRFVEDARTELAAAEDADAKLKQFFEHDPAVAADPLRFRHPRRYRIEILYTIHRNVHTDEAYRRIENLFHRTWPDLDVSLLEQTQAEQRSFYTLYADRLLKEQGIAEGIKGVELPPPKEGVDEAAIEEERQAAGYKIVQPQVDRELRVRGMYQHFQVLAREDPKKSLRVIFEKLREHDDPVHPVCSTEPGPKPAEDAAFDPNRPLVIYREFAEPLSGDDLEDLWDSGVKFTHNFRHRITSTGDKDLPKLGDKADVLGEAGHGRFLWRVLAVEQQRKKTFDELTPADKEKLRDDFYLPEQARLRAREALEAFRQRCMDGAVQAGGFREAAAALGARVHGEEWIQASFEVMSEPDKPLFWARELAHMRDRHFLRGNLASVLRAGGEHKAGDFLPVQVNARADKDDPGGAYLVLLHERRPSSAETIPPDDMLVALRREAEMRDAEERQRWSGRVESLLSDFEMEFEGEMQRRIEEELQRRQ